ncbi:MAG: MFS transporter [Rhodospirillaceae bacterium]|nr:MFS transporter [Rhodospirillaceae bacterium]
MTETSSGAGAGAATSGIGRQQAVALGLLFLVSLFNYGDRFLISILIPPIKAEFGLSDTQVGVLTGIGFTLFYALMGIPIASLADRTSRRAVIGWSLAAWSTLCAACGLVQNFAQLLIARVLLGVGEAGASPPSHALLAEIFPPHRRATALGIYTLGAPAGLVVGFSLGGILADAYGWRVVLFVFGVPGLILAAAIFRWLPEPPRAASVDPLARPLLGPTLRALARIPTLWHVILASSTFSFAWVSVLTWAPAYFTRTFQMPLGQVGPQLALVMGGSQFLALLIAGLLVDRLSRIDRRWYMWFGGGVVVLAAPFYALLFLAVTPGQAQGWLFAAFLLANMHTACALTVVQFVAGPNRRAVASACYLFLVNILSSLGPLVAGALSDAWAAELGTAALGRALLWVSVIFSVWCGLHGWLGGRSLPRDFAAADRAQ